MNARIFYGEREVAAIDPRDRGLAYGDGLFETMRVHRGRIPWLMRHRERLLRGARHLHMPLPPLDRVAEVIGELCAGGDADGVAKLIVTRGRGDRGYAPPSEAVPGWIVSRHPLPAPPLRGLRLHLCRTALSKQAELAGLKHCNRLEQVLARAEAEAHQCDEGLMRDGDGRVVSATSANFLLLRHGQWFTPGVERCGVAGVLRGWLLEQGLVLEADISLDEVRNADALALCNAVRGILPVESLGERQWAPHPALAELQGKLSMANPMFQHPRGTT